MLITLIVLWPWGFYGKFIESSSLYFKVEQHLGNDKTRAGQSDKHSLRNEHGGLLRRGRDDVSISYKVNIT